MIRKFLLAAALLAPVAAHGQAVQQSGSVTARHIPYWASNGVISDAGTSADSPISSIGVTNEGGAGFCVGSQRQSAAGRQLLCLSAGTSTGGVISLQNYGTATAQSLTFNINGTSVVLPTGGGTFVLANPPFTVGHSSCWLNTAGVLVDCGAGIVAGTARGLAYYTAADAIGSTLAGTDGQVPVATTSGAPAFKTLSGDVGSVSNAGAVTLAKVNGIPFASTYTAHGVLLGEGTSQFAATVTNNIGYCLLSQGLSSDPIWAACASGSGSAGGSTTQVQFNNATSLDGSVNLTWVSPTLTIGVAGTTTGKLGLASSTATGTVTLQATGVSTPYNFNFPTGAGSLGQPMISGGGGATPNTFGVLGIVGGGTNCAVASGTCLDNITGFASTGYLKRTGAGTYATASPIPVSDGGTNLASGTSGGILGFTASGTIASSALLTANALVIGGGAGATPTTITAGTNGQILVGATSAAPAFQTAGGDISAITSGGSFTIANSAISNAKLANSAGYTLKGNFTASAAAPQDSAISGLTAKASPATNDLIMIQDQAAGGQLKSATVSSIASAGSVSSIAGNTGAFTLSNGVTNSTNDIRLSGTFTSTSANAWTVGPNGTTNPTLNVDASTASAATGLRIKSAAAAGGLALSVITSGTNENLTINAAGSGTVSLGSVSTGSIVINTALTYGGVLLTNSVSGTGSMALAANTTFTGVTQTSTMNVSAALQVGGCSASSIVCANGITTSAGTNPLCWNSSTFQFTAAAAACTASDERVKTNFGPAPGLDAVNCLSGISFDWLDAEQARRGGRQIGFTAQAVQKCIPDVVSDNGESEIVLATGEKRIIAHTLSVDYARLTAVLVNAIKELAAARR